MAVNFSTFAVQNWLITPAARAVNEAPPQGVANQKWLLVLSGVGLIDLTGNNPNDWRRENLLILPDLAAPLRHAINSHGIPVPSGTVAVFAVEQWAPFAAVSSAFEKNTPGVDFGFAVDAWRPILTNGTASNGQPVRNVFGGIEADIAIRNNKAVMHRVSYQATVLGRIAFVPHVIL